MNGCTSDTPPALPSLAPPEAAPLQQRGVWDLALTDASVALDNALRHEHGPLGFKRWRLPATARLEDVQAFYERALGSGWQAVQKLPRRTLQAQLRAWHTQALLGHGRVFALAWLDEPSVLEAGAAPSRLMVTAFTREG